LKQEEPSESYQKALEEFEEVRDQIILAATELGEAQRRVQILWRYLWKIDHPCAILATWTELYKFAAKGNDTLNDHWIDLLIKHRLIEPVPSKAERPKAYYRKTDTGKEVESWIRKDWLVLREVLFFARPANR